MGVAVVEGRNHGVLTFLTKTGNLVSTKLGKSLEERNIIGKVERT